MRRALWTIALLLFCLNANATVYYHIHEPLQNTTGEALTGTTYYLYTPNTTDTTAVYSDRAGTATYQGSGNLQTGADGMIDVYVTAGCYDIYYSHSGHSLTGTLEDYCYGVGDSLDLEYGESTELKTTTLQLGSDAIGTLGTAYIEMPDNGIVWWRRDSDLAYKRRVPNFNGTYDSHKMFGFGGTTGKPTNWQLDEDVCLYYAFADAESTAATGSRYIDKPVIYLDPTDQPDSTNTDAYQSLIISNHRNDAKSWKWGKAQGDTCVGNRDGMYGVPNYGIRLQTDLPDSNGVNAYRDAVQIRWWMTPGSRTVTNAASRFLHILEHDTTHYEFCRDYFKVWSTDNEKQIILDGTGASAFTKLVNSGTAKTLFYANGSELELVGHDDGANDVTLDTHRVEADTVMFGINTVAEQGNLPTASGHTSQIWFNTALDSCWISTGAAWLQISLP